MIEKRREVRPLELQKTRIRPWSREWKAIRQMLNSEFPEDERVPLHILRFGTLRKDYICNFFRDGDKLAGFSYLQLADQAVFILYLAVNPELQSRGYGTAILKELEQNYPAYQIDVHIEAPKNPGSNKEQDARRYRFYERAGFRSTGWITKDDDTWYRILSNRGEAFDPEKHRVFLGKDGDTGDYTFYYEP